MKTMIRRTGFSAAGALKTVTAVMLAALLVLLPFLGGDAPAESANDPGISDYSYTGGDYYGIDRAAKSVFYVEVYNSKIECIASGSGFVMFDEGLFVTNQHVIEGATYLVVEDDDGDWYILDSVVVSDAEHDIAILLFPESSAYPSLEYDPSFDKLMRGQSVLAIGSPEGLSGTVSDGIISAFPLSESRDTRYIQITAPISHGSSGGCLLNDRLKVIGVTSAGYEEGENLGFAIPVFIVEQLYMQWNKKDSVTLGSETSWDTVGHGLHNKISGAIEKPQVQTGDSGNGHASPEPDTPAQPAAESSGGTTAGTGNEKAAVPEVWVCKGCQTENEQTKQYCTKCGNPWKSPLGTEQVGEILVTAGKNGSRKILRSEPDPDSNQVTVVYPGNRYPCYAVRLGSTRKPWYYVWVKEDYAWGWISSGFATLSE